MCSGGGAAEVWMVGSAIFGSIPGSASANVASSVGQIMPPLMGAGAFVMVELTGVPYEQIMLAVRPPALLYFYLIPLGVIAPGAPLRRIALIGAEFLL